MRIPFLSAALDDKVKLDGEVESYVDGRVGSTLDRYFEEQGVLRVEDLEHVPSDAWKRDARFADFLLDLADELDGVRKGSKSGTVFFTTDHLRRISGKIRHA